MASPSFLLQSSLLLYVMASVGLLRTFDAFIFAVAISMLSNQDENCRKALEQLPNLRGCQVHSTVMLSEVDHKIFKKLGVGLTCDPVKKIK